MKDHDDKFLKQWAKDFHAGHIFTSSMAKQESDLRLVFMVLLFMEKQDLPDPSKLGLIYEYYKEAGPRGVNGMPMFMSCGFLTKNDVAKVKVYLERIEKAMKGALEDDAPAKEDKDAKENS